MVSNVNSSAYLTVTVWCSRNYEGIAYNGFAVYEEAVHHFARFFCGGKIDDAAYRIGIFIERYVVARSNLGWNAGNTAQRRKIEGSAGKRLLV